MVAIVAAVCSFTTLPAYAIPGFHIQDDASATKAFQQYANSTAGFAAGLARKCPPYRSKTGSDKDGATLYLSKQYF